MAHMMDSVSTRYACSNAHCVRSMTGGKECAAFYYHVVLPCSAEMTGEEGHTVACAVSSCSRCVRDVAVEVSRFYSCTLCNVVDEKVPGRQFSCENASAQEECHFRARHHGFACSGNEG